MYKIFHHSICPFSRKIRIYLAAKNIPFELIVENFWEKRAQFIALNPAATVPILFDEKNNQAISPSSAIIEFLEENFTEENFIGNTPFQKAESRRIQAWFDEKFYNEVSRDILHERIFKRYLRSSNSPDSELLRNARQNLVNHLEYIESLLGMRKYLNGEQITLADIAGAAHISVLDYFGDINWAHYQLLKDWYSLVKSHKFFSEILKDRLPNIAVPAWYANLDF